MSNKLWESHITWICYSFIRLPFIWYVIINFRPGKRSLFYDIRLLYKITKRRQCRDPAALWDCKKKIFTKWCQDCEPLLSSGCSLVRKKSTYQVIISYTQVLESSQLGFCCEQLLYTRKRLTENEMVNFCYTCMLNCRMISMFLKFPW